MAMKKSPYKKETNNAERWDVELHELSHILSQAEEQKNGMKFELADHIYLFIFDNENGADTAYLNLYGVSIRADVRAYEKDGKTTYFLSYPSFKKKDGTYSQQVKCYSNNINSVINDVLDSYYN